MDVICTDRHSGIKSLMKSNQYADIDHQVNVWHLAKNVCKQLMAQAKRKECDGLHEWIPVSNTTYGGLQGHVVGTKLSC